MPLMMDQDAELIVQGPYQALFALGDHLQDPIVVQVNVETEFQQEVKIVMITQTMGLDAWQDAQGLLKDGIAL